MRIQRLQTRITVLFVALLALVQVAAFCFVNAANSSNAHAKVEEDESEHGSEDKGGKGRVGKEFWKWVKHPYILQ